MKIVVVGDTLVSSDYMEKQAERLFPGHDKKIVKFDWEMKTKEEFLELYEKYCIENYEPTIEFRNEILNLTMLGYINLGYDTMIEIRKQMDEIIEKALNKRKRVK